MRWKFFLVGVLSGAYGLTLAPGLTWANHGADGGDLITAAATLGVAHPTGYPTYLLLAHLFQYLPIGNLAFRTNLFSAVCAVSAALVIQVLVQRVRGSELAGLVSGLALGLGALVWSQAVITEVYTLHALGVALTLLSIARLGENAPLTRRDHALALALGLALGNHLTTLVLVPFYLGALGLRRAPQLLLSLSAGLAVYLYLPLRAAAQPPINWGAVNNLASFWWLVSGAAYQHASFQFSLAELLPRVVASLQQLLAQWGWPGLLLGLAGAFMPAPRYWRITLLGVALAAFSFAVEYNVKDYFVHLLPVYLVFSIWLGMGGAALAARLIRWWPRARAGLGLAALAGLAVHLSVVGPQVSARADHRAEEFLTTVLTQAPPQAVLATYTDEHAFALWYARFAQGARPDLVIIVEPMLGQAWYRAHLRAAFPGLSVPEQAGLSAYPIAWRNARPICWVALDSSNLLQCSPP